MREGNAPGKPKVAWYFDPLIVFVAILAVGPLAIPLVWMSPAFKKWHKTAITIAIIVITVWAINSSIALYKKLMEEFTLLKDAMK